MRRTPPARADAARADHAAARAARVPGAVRGAEPAPDRAGELRARSRSSATRSMSCSAAKAPAARWLRTSCCRSARRALRERSSSTCLEHSGVERHVVGEFGWPDPQSSAASVTFGELGLTLRGFDARARARASPECGRAGRLLPAVRRGQRGRVERDRNRARSGRGAERGRRGAHHAGCAARTIAARARQQLADPRGGHLLPRPQRRRPGVHPARHQRHRRADLRRRWRSRGSSERPTTLLVGDIGFLHDVGGLFAARSLRVPFVVVVLNNDGGSDLRALAACVACRRCKPSSLQPWIVAHGLELEARGRALSVIATLAWSVPTSCAPRCARRTARPAAP